MDRQLGTEEHSRQREELANGPEAEGCLGYERECEGARGDGVEDKGQSSN